MVEKTNLAAVNETPRLWKIEEAAAFLNINSGTLYHWVSEMRVPCLRFGSRCLRFDPQQLKQWAAAFCCQPQEDE